MAYAGDQGSFEIPDQVKWMQSLAPMMEGVASGKDAVAEIGASLQIAKSGQVQPMRRRITLKIF